MSVWYAGFGGVGFDMGFLRDAFTVWGVLGVVGFGLSRRSWPCYRRANRPFP